LSFAIEKIKSFYKNLKECDYDQFDKHWPHGRVNAAIPYPAAAVSIADFGAVGSLG
jgi:hypothetical protein